MNWNSTPAGTQRFTELMQGLAATFRVQADEALFMGYEMALDDLPIDTIAGAVRRACRECQFMPSGAELRKMCGVQSPEARALTAWEIVKKSVGSCGGYASVTFDDPVINATIRTLGGWVSLCDTPAGDEFDKWKRKEFERVYRELWNSGVSPEMARPLIGLTAQENSATGFIEHIPEPLRIETGLPPEPHKLLGGGSSKRIGVASELASRIGVER